MQLHPLLRPTILWILLRSFFLTFRVCLVSLVQMYLGKFNRARADQRLAYWSSQLLKIASLRFTLQHQERIDLETPRPLILMSNHQGYYDIPLLMAALSGRVRMWAKKELFHLPVIGKAMRQAGFVPIDRINRRGAPAMLEESSKAIKEGTVLWIAPEGACSTTGKLGPLKKGGFLLALRSDALLVPIGISGSMDVLPVGTWDIRTGCNVKLRVGKPIDCAEYGKSGLSALMKRVENELGELIDLGVGVG